MTAASLFDPELSSLLDRLHTRAARQERGLFLRFLDQLPRLVTGRE